MGSPVHYVRGSGIPCAQPLQTEEQATRQAEEVPFRPWENFDGRWGDKDLPYPPLSHFSPLWLAWLTFQNKRAHRWIWKVAPQRLASPGMELFNKEKVPCRDRPRLHVQRR